MDGDDREESGEGHRSGSGKSGRGRGRFPTTRWTLVRAAGAGSREALAELCEIYWPPVHAFIRARRRAEDAPDLAQAFFTEQLIPPRKSQLLLKPDRCFRSWLLRAVRNHLSHVEAQRRTLKRGGGALMPSLDHAHRTDPETDDSAPGHEPGHWQTPERVYHRRWALLLIERALDRLEREESRRRGDRRPELFAALRPFLVGPAGEQPVYAPIAQAFERDLDNIAKIVCQLRLRFGQLLYGEIADTVASPSDVLPELRFLLDALTLPSDASPVWTQRDA